MLTRSTRLRVLSLVVVSMALLLPGLFAPVLTIRGVLTRDGLTQVAPQLLERGLGDETVATLRSMMNPTTLALLQLTGTDLKTALVSRLTPEITRSLAERGEEIEVYRQTRSIVGAVDHLYRVGSPVPATLILLFSVVVPLAKAATVALAVFAGVTARRRMVDFVVAIAKWSMADVFAVGLFIVYLAAQAAHAAPGESGGGSSILGFSAAFGPGFYWFASYCVFSLASQQYTARVLARE